MGDLSSAIQTGPDRLLILVKDAQKISYVDAANILQVPTEVVERWAEILEESGHVNTRNTLRGNYLLSMDVCDTNALTALKLYLHGLGGAGSSSVDYQLAQTRTELERERTTLKEKLRAVAAFEAQLESRTEQLTKQAKRLHQDEQSLIQERRLVNDRAEVLAEREISLERKQREHNTQLATLVTKAQKLDKREKLLDRRTGYVRKNRDEAFKKLRELRRQQKEQDAHLKLLLKSERTLRTAADKILRALSND